MSKKTFVFSAKKQGCQIKSKDQQKTEIKGFIEIISLKSKYYKPSEKTNVCLNEIKDKQFIKVRYGYYLFNPKPVLIRNKTSV